MMKITIIAKDNRVITGKQEKQLVLGDVALMICEIERIKLDLLSREFAKNA